MDTLGSHKHWRNLWEKGIECIKNHKHTLKYKHLKRTIEQQLRSAYWNYDDGNQKSSYAKKHWTYLWVYETMPYRPPLHYHYSDKMEPYIQTKADILNQQVQSVFADDQSHQETNPYNSTLPEMPDIEITETGIY